MKRNRIVINLEEKAAGQRSRRSGGTLRLLLIIAVILLLVGGGLAAGGYFWWRHYQTGPGYSLALMVDGAQRNDGATIDSILDTDKISNDLVSQVRQKMPGGDPSLWPSPVDSVKNSISNKLRDTVREQLIKETRDLSDVAAGKPFIIIALAVPRFVDIKQQDQTAQAIAHIKDQQIQLTMQSVGNRWRVVAVKDDKLASMVADALVHSVPTNGPQLEDTIKRQLNKLNK